MPELEVLIEAPHDVLELRDEIGDLFATGPSSSDVVETIESYAEVASPLWGELVVQATTDTYGEDVEVVGRDHLLTCCGKVVMDAAKIECAEITKRIDSSSNLTRRQRLVRRIRDVFGLERKVAVDAAGVVALDIFNDELRLEERGSIKHAEDLRPVVERSAHKFITSKYTVLDLDGFTITN